MYLSIQQQSWDVYYAYLHTPIASQITDNQLINLMINKGKSDLEILQEVNI